MKKRFEIKRKWAVLYGRENEVIKIFSIYLQGSFNKKCVSIPYRLHADSSHLHAFRRVIRNFSSTQKQISHQKYSEPRVAKIKIFGFPHYTCFLTKVLIYYILTSTCNLKLESGFLLMYQMSSGGMLQLQKTRFWVHNKPFSST